MSAIEADLRTLLNAQATITAVVGAGNIHCGREPQSGALPYIVLHEMSKDGNPSLDGATDGLQFCDYDIDCYGKTYGQAKDLAKIVRDFIKDFSGATGGTQTIGAVLMNDEIDDEIEPNDGTDNYKYLTTLDLTIQFNPT